MQLNAIEIDGPCHSLTPRRSSLTQGLLRDNAPYALPNAT